MRGSKSSVTALYKLIIRKCITATSVPCDGVFSKTGRILFEKRGKLSASKVSQVVFLNSYFK